MPRHFCISFALGALTLLYAQSVRAREPVGKGALDAIAKIGASVEDARRALGKDGTEEIFGDNGLLTLMKDGISIGTCGKVFGVTRQLGFKPEIGMNAVMAISSVAGAPSVSSQNVIGSSGAVGLSFSWKMIPDYSVTIIKSAEGWSVTEGTFRKGFCTQH